VENDSAVYFAISCFLGDNFDKCLPPFERCVTSKICCSTADFSHDYQKGTLPTEVIRYRNLLKY
jgi:hypothetical protein